VILPDVNLLIHAYNPESPLHPAARTWWEECLNGPKPVFLAWVVALGFLRLTTHRRLSDRPLSARRACEIVELWLARPQVAILNPGDRHARILFELIGHLGTAGNLTTDAHLAALAIEHQVELRSTDADFARFPGLRWQNPLKKTPPLP
jgi:toxin-antitoxin system PIN domain toxin